jgi:hypothetical protein
MFLAEKSFNQNLAKWNASRVSSMYGMFYGASSFNQSLCDWFKPFSSSTYTVVALFSLS